MNQKRKLSKDDIIAIAEMCKDEEYSTTLYMIADGMCWDDSIVTDGECTEIIHG